MCSSKLPLSVAAMALAWAVAMSYADSSTPLVPDSRHSTVEAQCIGDNSSGITTTGIIETFNTATYSNNQQVSGGQPAEGLFGTAAFTCYSGLANSNSLVMNFGADAFAASNDPATAGANGWSSNSSSLASDGYYFTLAAATPFTLAGSLSSQSTGSPAVNSLSRSFVLSRLDSFGTFYVDQLGGNVLGIARTDLDGAFYYTGTLPAGSYSLSGNAGCTAFAGSLNGATGPLVSMSSASANSMVTLTGSLPGDTNDDGIVNFTDFVALSNHFATSNSGWSGGDFNNDGVTNFADFVILSNNWGRSFAGNLSAIAASETGSQDAASVPEPASLALLALVTAPVLIGHRARRLPRRRPG